MSTHARPIIALLLAASLAGCALGGGKNAPTVYAPEPRIAADTAWPTVAWQLAIGNASAPRMLDSLRIAVSPLPGELQVYKGAQWARTPADMLEDGVLGALEDSGRIRAVARQGSGMAPDYRLAMDVRHFEARYDAGAAGAPAAVVEVHAKLLHARDHVVVGSRTFRHQQAAAGTDVGLVADAFAQALGATTGDIAGWTLVTGEAHRRQAHPR